MAINESKTFLVESKVEIIVSFLLISIVKESIVFWYCLSLSEE